MKLEVRKYALLILPETPLDEVFLEEVLGLRKNGEWAPLTRKNAVGLSCWACAEATKRQGAP